MSLHRFFLTSELAAGDSAVDAPLSAADLHHACDVLRIQPGEEIELVSPSGAGWRARVESLGDGGGGLVVTLLAALERRGGVASAITLVQGIAKGEKMDLIVRQATELGAAAVLPIITTRCIVRLPEGKRADKGARWRRVAKAAAEQSHRDRLPEVGDPVDFEQAVALLGYYDLVLVLWEEAGETAQGIVSAIAERQLPAEARVALVVGPEGGLAADEVAALESGAAAVAVTLGPGILRTETAAAAALALASYALGGMGAK